MKTVGSWCILGCIFRYLGNDIIYIISRYLSLGRGGVTGQTDMPANTEATRSTPLGERTGKVFPTMEEALPCERTE